MTKLSPAAQAVWDAYNDVCERVGVFEDYGDALAAAFRAAADQVVPEESDPDPIKAWSIDDWNHMNITRYQREETRRDILAIAAELEANR